jgi:hypothetical protein
MQKSGTSDVNSEVPGSILSNTERYTHEQTSYSAGCSFLNAQVFNDTYRLLLSKRHQPLVRPPGKPEVDSKVPGSVLSISERYNHQQTSYSAGCSFVEGAGVQLHVSVVTFKTTSTLNAKTWQFRSSFRSARFRA